MNQQSQEAVKHVLDVGGAGAVFVAWMDVINAGLEMVGLVLAIAWGVYRVLEARRAHKRRAPRTDSPGA